MPDTLIVAMLPTPIVNPAITFAGVAGHGYEATVAIEPAAFKLKRLRPYARRPPFRCPVYLPIQRGAIPAVLLCCA